MPEDDGAVLVDEVEGLEGVADGMATSVALGLGARPRVLENH